MSSDKRASAKGAEDARVIPAGATADTFCQKCGGTVPTCCSCPEAALVAPTMVHSWPQCQRCTGWHDSNLADCPPLRSSEEFVVVHQLPPFPPVRLSKAVWEQWQADNARRAAALNPVSGCVRSER